MLNRVAAAKAAKEEIGSPRADRPTPTKPKVEPNLKRHSSGSMLGSDASTPMKRTPSKGKMDLDEDDQELFDSLFDEDGDCEFVEDDVEVEKKVCLACFRVTTVDEHHLVPGVAMPWLYDKSRGNFCRDCCGTYRVLFKGTMGMALFARWLKANRNAFMCRHIPYLSLKHEGVNHVTKGAVEQREKMLRFVYSLSGMPYPLACVVPYDSDKFKHHEKFFVPYFGKSEEAPSSVVALVARPMPDGPAPSTSTRFVTKAHAAVAWPLLPLGAAPVEFTSWWTLLGTDVASEVAVSPRDGGAGSEQERRRGRPEDFCANGLERIPGHVARS